MSRRRIYTLTVRASALGPASGETSAAKQLSRLAEVAGSGSVATTGTNPGDLRLSGDTRGKYAEIIATEIRELLTAPSYESVEVYAVGETIPQAGYYAPESSTGGRRTAQSSSFNQFDGTLVREGTRRSHWRAVEMTQESITTVTNDFGSDNSSTDVGVPAAATQVRWFNPSTNERTAPAAPTVTATRNAEFGDVDVYDADSAPYSDPTLLFDLEYSEAGNVDAAVFDTYANSRTDADGDFAWGQVFRPDHEFAGDIIVSNGLLRLTLNESNGITAEQWNDGTSQWDSVSLGASSWQLTDADLTHLSPAGVEAQLVFEDTVGGSTHTLDMFVLRGWDEAVFARTQSATSATPAGLQTLLSPVASDNVQIPGATTTIIPRKEARE